MSETINSILQSFVNFVNSTVGRVPDLCPFKEPIESFRDVIGFEYLGYVNYFVPIPEILAILSVWVSAIFIYYGVSIVLRWVKAIS